MHFDFSFVERAIGGVVARRLEELQPEIRSRVEEEIRKQVPEAITAIVRAGVAKAIREEYRRLKSEGLLEVAASRDLPGQMRLFREAPA